MTRHIPIDPADIRVGDLVEQRFDDGTVHIRRRFTAAAMDDETPCGIYADKMGCAYFGGEWFLVDRPDPDAALIERVVAEIDGFPFESTTEADARAVLAAIRETHDIVPKGGE